MNKTLLIIFLLFFRFVGFSQSDFFLSAYKKHPNIPPGLLEAVSYTHTKIQNLSPDEIPSCLGMPLPFGVMGVFEDGAGYFTENARYIATLSGISIAEQKSSVDLQIEAYARACDHILSSLNRKKMEPSEVIYALLLALTEIPQNCTLNAFAFETSVYDVFLFLTDEDKAARFSFSPYNVDLSSLFGKNNYQLLRAPKITISETAIRGENNQEYIKPRHVKSANYGPALWTAAPSCNYSSRNGTPISAVTVHTVQGSYAGAISWGLNCNAGVSYHYVVRSSDGQVTQMVLESNKAWHVGSSNAFTIGIEHEGYVSNASWYTEALYQSSATLVRDITQSGYGINPLRTYDGPSNISTQLLGSCVKIKGHQHYANQTHTDPGIHWDWNKYYKLINNSVSPTVITSSSGILYDTGGANGNYGSDERSVWVIEPTILSTVSLHFSSFALENDYDKLFIYDGNSVNSPLIGSYTGSTMPPTIQSTSTALTLEFRSDCATTLSGWSAQFQSQAISVDTTPPTCTITYNGTWQTNDFIAQLNAQDDESGVFSSYYLVTSRAAANTPLYANKNYGFFQDEFHLSSNIWTNQTGTYVQGAGVYTNQDATQSNSNSYALLSQDQSHSYLYSWKQKITSSNPNQRAGIHFFCSDATLPNRGNSYFVYFREETDKVQIYKVTNDQYALVYEADVVIAAYQWYTMAVEYNPTTGFIYVFSDFSLVAQWQDSNPLLQGNAISLRSGGCSVAFDDVRVYHSHSPQEIIEIGNGKAIEHQSDNEQASGNIVLIGRDPAGNWSNPFNQWVQVDWSPAVVGFVADGTATDIDTFYMNPVSSHWSFQDPHSGIQHFEFAMGSSLGGTDLIPWNNVGLNQTNSITLNNLQSGLTAYTSINAINKAGIGSVQSSDGQVFIASSGIEANPLVSVQFFPNPNTGDFLQVSGLPFPVQLYVYDVNGRIIKNHSLPSDGVVPLNVSQGVYYLQMVGNGYTKTDKIQVH
jgi:N-acetyl-anhydromuramyl-L-alanine amidase AmpD